MKILITNSVPLNGGDEALLRATMESLKNKFPGVEIKVLCLQLDICRKYLPDIEFDSSLEFMKYDKNGISRLIRHLFLNKLKLKQTSIFSLMLASRDERRVIKHYKNADIIISSPGGFLHDFYPVHDRLNVLEMAVDMGKKVVILAQSIGPFWLDDSKTQAKTVFKKLYKIFLRDEISYQFLNDMGLPMNNVYITSDAAFLWRKLAPELYIQKGAEIRIIAMCFREWKYGNMEMDTVLDNAVKLCKHILKEDNRQIHFLSTCQGIDSYTDDSIFADRIIQLLPEEFKNKCTIDRKKYSPRDLIKEYSKCDAFIGMRLHSAILSMLGGTPAMGLGYEDKTKGIFSQLGFKDYQVDASSTYEKWIECLEKFMKDFERINNQLPTTLDKIAIIAENNLDIL